MTGQSFCQRERGEQYKDNFNKQKPSAAISLHTHLPSTLHNSCHSHTRAVCSGRAALAIAASCRCPARTAAVQAGSPEKNQAQPSRAQHRSSTVTMLTETDVTALEENIKQNKGRGETRGKRNKKGIWRSRGGKNTKCRMLNWGKEGENCRGKQNEKILYQKNKIKQMKNRREND